jgi:hypothetical protein
MSDLSRRTKFFSGILAGGLSLIATAGYATQCGPNKPVPPTVNHISNGVNIICTSDTSDPNRSYGAVILLRDNEEIPLYEGGSYDPFDGTSFDFTTDDGYDSNDQFFTRTICDAQYDSPPRSRLIDRGGLHTLSAFPKPVQDAIKALRKAYRNAIPRPKFIRFQPGASDKVIVGLRDWTPPTVDLSTIAPGVTLVGTRAALKRKALGIMDSDPTENPNTPENPGNLPSDDQDNATAHIMHKDKSGRVINLDIPLKRRNVLLYGDLDEVFGHEGSDPVIRTRRYKYYTEVYFTLGFGDKRYNAGVRGKKRLRLRIVGSGPRPVEDTSYEPVADPNENN